MIVELSIFLRSTPPPPPDLQYHRLQEAPHTSPTVEYLPTSPYYKSMYCLILRDARDPLKPL